MVGRGIVSGVKAYFCPVGKVVGWPQVLLAQAFQPQDGKSMAVNCPDFPAPDVSPAALQKAVLQQVVRAG